MAVYLDIKLVEHSAAGPVYEFSTTDGRSGRLLMDSATGTATVTQAMPGDDTGGMAARAARGVVLRRGQNAEWPTKAYWAS